MVWSPQTFQTLKTWKILSGAFEQMPTKQQLAIPE
jgi:hypothetical protein